MRLRACRQRRQLPDRPAQAIGICEQNLREYPGSPEFKYPIHPYHHGAPKSPIPYIQ